MNTVICEGGRCLAARPGPPARGGPSCEAHRAGGWMTMRIPGIMFLISSTIIGVSTAAIATIPIPTTDIVWHGDFDGQGGVLSGNCGVGQDGYCQKLTVRDEQI